MLVDSHCHLDLLDLDACGGSVEAALEAAAAQQVGRVLSVSVSLERWPALSAIAERYAQVSVSVGVHPSHEPGAAVDGDEIVRLARHPRVVAIGETGLDYHYGRGDLAWQRERFRAHIEAARVCGKPLIVHTREAAEDTVSILRESAAEVVGGVMHCFTEDWSVARQCLDLNFYISFSGVLTFKNAESVREVARRVPLDRVLVETDAPYLAPVPHRGQPNQPAYLPWVAQRLADLRGMELHELAELTTRNYRRLFGGAPC